MTLDALGLRSARRRRGIVLRRDADQAGRDGLQDRRRRPDPGRDGHPGQRRDPGPGVRRTRPRSWAWRPTRCSTSPTGGSRSTWENKLKIIAEIRAHRPRIVFAPYWIDRHPDHENASQLVRAAAYLAGLKKIETGQEAFRPVKLVFCQSRFEFAPSFVVDITDAHARKMNAIRAYASQFHRPDRRSRPHPRPPRIRRNAHRPARIPGRTSRPGTADTAPRSASSTASRFSSGKP